MYELSVKKTFSAAHNLRDYRGKCEHLHGHNYTAEVFVRKGELDKSGLAVDFSDVKGELAAVLERLDHKYLNEDVDYFKKNNPSAENIAGYIYREMKKNIKTAELVKVCVYESENAKACYFEEEK